jgi:hypothetical protein
MVAPAGVSFAGGKGLLARPNLPVRERDRFLDIGTDIESNQWGRCTASALDLVA